MKEILPNSKSRILLFIASLVCLGSLASPLVAVATSSNDAAGSVSSENTTKNNSRNEESEDTENEQDDGDEENEDDEAYEFSTDLIIHAVRPTYSTDDDDVGGLIELRNLSDTTISLAGFSLRYINGSGKKTTIVNFADGTLMAGEYLLMRYSKSPNKDEADFTYTVKLSLTTGSLELTYDDEPVDGVCWTGSKGCSKVFQNAAPTTLVRKLKDGTFIHLAEYVLHFDPLSPSVIFPPEPENPEEDKNEEKLAPQCRGLEFTEVYSYYADSQSEQFIELYNPSSSAVNISGCAISYKNKTYALDGIIPADGYFAYYPNGKFSLTKNPASSNTIQLIDTDQEMVDEVVYSNGQKKSASYAKFYNNDGTEKWVSTYNVTPGRPNAFQEFKTCPDGKVINPATGNCVNATSTTTTIKECGEGKYLNPLTNRCKSIASTTELQPCAEGYERNPETNRCRKITTANTGAEYAIVPNTRSTKTTFIAFGTVAAIVSIGIGYIVLQFRHEIARAARKLSQRAHDIRNNLLSRRASRHTDKKS